MSRTVALVCACFLLFGLPGTVIRLADPTFSAPLLHASYFWIYWAQYRDWFRSRMTHYYVTLMNDSYYTKSTSMPPQTPKPLLSK